MLPFAKPKPHYSCDTFVMGQISQTVQSLLPKPLDFVEVAILERDGIIESRHRGIAALTDDEGKLID